jgi:hypothetical protein
MRNLIIGITLALIVIVIGIGMSTGKIKIPGTSISNNQAPATSTSAQVSVVSEKKVDEQKGKVLYTLTTPVVTDVPILQKNIDDYVDGFKKSIVKAAEEINFEGASSNYSLNISYEVIRNDQKAIVIRMSASEYTGGAHGNPSFAFFMYDVGAKRMIGEEEVFVNKKDSALLALVANALIKNPQYSFEDGGVTKSMFFDVDENKATFIANLSTSGNIALTQNGVLFKYGAYAIGPYVLGEPEVEMSLTSVEPFLTSYAKTFFK